jgi:hypothetical protein
MRTMGKPPSVIKWLEEAVENYKRKCKENPRHNIEFLADEGGHVRVYLDFTELWKYNRGSAAFGSTERFDRGDFVVLVPVERIEKITDGNTIVHTREWGS